jgi:hypothetical protein
MGYGFGGAVLMLIVFIACCFLGLSNKLLGLRKKRMHLRIITLLFAGTIFFGCHPSEEIAEDLLMEEEQEELTDSLEHVAEINIEFLEDLARFNSHAELEAFFGKENLKKTESWRAEGTVRFPVTILYPNSDHSVHIFWKEESKVYEELSFIELNAYIYDEQYNPIYADFDHWKLKNGLRLNMSINDLEKLNGGSFTFYGFGWDYGGSTNLKNEIFKHYHVILDFMNDPDKDLPVEYEELLGDQEISSKHPAARELGVSIASIIYTPN